jgi:UDP-glucose 4-epimerase
MRILLTGSSGWLGRYLAPRLRHDGHDVVGLDVAPGDETRIVGTVADRTVVDRAFAEYGIEAVIHAAALHKPDIVRYAAQAFVDVNVTGSLNLLAAAVAAGHDRFVFTSTTSLMISAGLHAGPPLDAAGRPEAAWLTESTTPLEPRNIYGVTKLSAEHLCRLYYLEYGLATIVLRTGRFFPEDDDTLAGDGCNLKANEFLNRRLTVEDAAEAHVVALNAAPAVGHDTLIVAAPSPFTRADCGDLVVDAAGVIARHHPDAVELYAQRGWRLPDRIDRVYVAERAERVLGFRCRTDFGTILDALRRGEEPPVVHDPTYTSPKERAGR